MPRLRLASDKPVVTYTVMLLCVLVPPLSMAPQLTSGLVFTPVAALAQPRRLLTAGFVHAGYLHLACNVLVLWIAGTALERLLGQARYLAFYLLATVTSYVLALALAVFTPLSSPFVVTVGASGGIFALFMANLLIQRHFGDEIKGIAIFLGLSFLDGFVRSNISWEVHLGGIVGGALLAAGLLAAARLAQQRSRKQGFSREVYARTSTLASTAVFLAVALVDVAVWAATYAAVTG